MFFEILREMEITEQKVSYAVNRSQLPLVTASDFPKSSDFLTQAAFQSCDITGYPFACKQGLVHIPPVCFGDVNSSQWMSVQTALLQHTEERPQNCALNDWRLSLYHHFDRKKTLTEAIQEQVLELDQSLVKFVSVFVNTWYSVHQSLAICWQKPLLTLQ